MTFTQKTLLAFAMTFAPLSAVAAVPSTITSIEARLSSGILTVTWAPPRDSTGIAFYHLYFSHESILENDGNYDDIERTKGLETMITFTKPPLQSKQIFFAVLAVNAAGTESEGFETEASVDVPQSAEAPVSSRSSSIVNAGATSQTPETGTAQTGAQASGEPAFVPYVRNPMLEQVTGSSLPVLPTAETPVSGTLKPTGKKDLPDSGLELFGIVGVSGLLAGRRFLRFKQQGAMPARGSAEV